MATFKHPTEDRTVTVGLILPMIATLFFGLFYFAFRGAWRWTAIHLLLGILTGGLSWFLVWPFAPLMLAHELRANGWKEVSV